MLLRQRKHAAADYSQSAYMTALRAENWPICLNPEQFPDEI